MKRGVLLCACSAWAEPPLKETYNWFSDCAQCVPSVRGDGLTRSEITACLQDLKLDCSVTQQAVLVLDLSLACQTTEAFIVPLSRPAPEWLLQQVDIGYELINSESLNINKFELGTVDASCKFVPDLDITSQVSCSILRSQKLIKLDAFPSHIELNDMFLRISVPKAMDTLLLSTTTYSSRVVELTLEQSCSAAVIEAALFSLALTVFVV